MLKKSTCSTIAFSAHLYLNSSTACSSCCVLPHFDLPSTFSSELTQLSGVAAILRFPIADLSEPEDDSSSDEDWSTETEQRSLIGRKEEEGRPVLQITQECIDSVCYKTIKAAVYFTSATSTPLSSLISSNCKAVLMLWFEGGCV